MKKIKLIVNRDCEHCGNPKKMYWCKDCESNGETVKCDQCGAKTVIDKEYHNDCGKKSYVIVGDNNYWYATPSMMTEAEAIKELKRVKKEIEAGYYENNEAEELYLFEAVEVERLSINVK